MEHEGQLTVPAVNRLDIMPYWPDYEAWIEHLNKCEVCGETMTVGNQELTSLCPVGLKLQEDLRNGLRAQSALASLN